MREVPGDIPGARRSRLRLRARVRSAAEVDGQDERNFRVPSRCWTSRSRRPNPSSRDDPLRVSYAETLVKRYNNAARVKLRAGELEGARDMAAQRPGAGGAPGGGGSPQCRGPDDARLGAGDRERHRAQGRTLRHGHRARAGVHRRGRAAARGDTRGVDRARERGRCEAIPRRVHVRAAATTLAAATASRGTARGSAAPCSWRAARSSASWSSAGSTLARRPAPSSTSTSSSGAATRPSRGSVRRRGWRLFRWDCVWVGGTPTRDPPCRESSAFC